MSPKDEQVQAAGRWSGISPSFPGRARPARVSLRSRCDLSAPSWCHRPTLLSRRREWGNCRSARNLPRGWGPRCVAGQRGIWAAWPLCGALTHKWVLTCGGFFFPGRAGTSASVGSVSVLSLPGGPLETAGPWGSAGTRDVKKAPDLLRTRGCFPAKRRAGRRRREPGLGLRAAVSTKGSHTHKERVSAAREGRPVAVHRGRSR